MLESRSTYGYCGGTMKTPKATQVRWQVCYRCHDGNFGIVGYQLFDTKEEADAWAEKFKAEKSYVKETWARHPAPIYSGY